MDSFITWIGGKKLLRKEIVKRFPQYISRYVEVFGGAAWVLFYKEKYAEQEVYNDINSDLVNLFQCIKKYPKEVLQELKFTLNAREIFNKFKQDYNKKELTDIQRAAMFYYMIRTSYGAKLEHYSANYRSPYLLLQNAEKIAKRLSKVVIENKSFTDILTRYDKEGTLFYCDPPYYKAEKVYHMGDYVFDKEQHILLRDSLKSIKGHFVLSYNDDEFIKNLYEGFDIQEVERSSNLSLNNGKKGMYKELIITNF